MANSANTSPLVLAIFPRRPPKLTKKMYQPLADYLSHGLGRTVTLVVNKEFANFWSGVGKKEYDIVHYNQFHYVKSNSLYGYNVIAKSEEFGASTITPAIWVRKDHMLKSLQDLKGKRVMFGGGKMALVAGLGNQQLLMKAGLETGDYEKQLAISPMAGCRAMYLGQVDACGGATIFTSQPSVQKAIDTTQIEILAQNQPLPGIPWAIKEDMDKGLGERISTLLQELNSRVEGQQILKSAALTGLHAANDTEYNICRELIFDVLDEQY
jgi:phosphonate transport system substrate-binding protein